MTNWQKFAKSGHTVTNRQWFGSVGPADASDINGPLIESSQRQTLYYLKTFNWIEKTKIKKKEAKNILFQNKLWGPNNAKTSYHALMEFSLRHTLGHGSLSTKEMNNHTGPIS